MADFKTLKKLLSADLQALESSGLEYANPERFLEFKNGYLKLSNEIARYEEQYRDGVTPYSVVEAVRNIWSGLGPSFDMYMDGWGYKEITEHKSHQIKNVINDIINKMNYDNYDKMQDELNATLTLYKDTLGDSVITEEIRALLERFNYQILKYKLRVNVIDDSNINRYISFILEDIKSILNDSKVSLNIKKELQKYFVDRELVRNNFKIVMILINLGITKKQVTDEELKDSLAEMYYRAQDIVPEYHEPSKKIIGDAGSTAIDDIGKCYRYESKECPVKETVPMVLIKEIKRNNIYDNPDSKMLKIYMEQLIEKDFKDIKYLAEALIVNDCFAWFMALRLGIYNLGKNYDYEFDCVIMAYCDKISPDKIARYIAISENKYLIDYIIRKKNIKCFSKLFIDYAIFHNNRYLLSFIDDNSNLLLKEILASEFDIKYKRLAINKYLSDEAISETTKKEHLVIIYKTLLTEVDFSLKRIIIESLLTFNDAEIIIYLLRIVYLCFNRGDGVLVHVERDVPLVIDTIPAGNLKEMVLDYLYDIKKDLNNILIPRDLKNIALNGEREQLSNEFIASCNDFTAAYITNNTDSFEFDVMEMIKFHYKARLNWPRLIENLSNLTESQKLEFYKYLYFGNRELYFKMAQLPNIHDAREMVEEYPQSVVDFLQFMSVSDIANLPMSTLAIFAEFYEQQLSSNNLSVDDKIRNCLATKTNDLNEEKALLTFIAFNGLMNHEIMFYYLNRIDLPYSFANLILLAIKNAQNSYLKASFLAEFRDCNNNIADEEINMVLLNKNELAALLNDIKNPEAQELKIRRYYGSLLKLLSKVSKNMQYRIIKEIAKSNIREFILNIKINYPDFLPLLIDNISDISIASELISDTTDITESKPRS